MPRITVCKDCTDRYLGCHDHCERYLTQRADGYEARDKYLKETQGNTDLTRIRTEKKYKKIKKYGRKLW